MYTHTYCSETMKARQAAEEAGRSGTQAAKANNITGMSLTEAKQILNIQDLKDLPAIRKVNTLRTSV